MNDTDATAVSFFDCNATIGAAASPILGNVLSAQELLAEMNVFSIDEALITHTFSQELHYREGTALTIRAATVSDRLHPVATVLAEPLARQGPDAPIAYLEAVLAAGAEAIRVHPDPTHHIMDRDVYGRQFPLSPHALDYLFKRLETQSIPLFVEMVQSSWDEVYAVCERYPGMPVVLLNVSYTQKRSLLAGLQRHSNLYCDISGYHAHRGIEEVCDLYGPTKLLFGTRLPLYNAMAAVSMLAYADLPIESLKAIAGGNLRALLSWRPRDDESAPSTGAHLRALENQ